MHLPPASVKKALSHRNTNRKYSKKVSSMNKGKKNDGVVSGERIIMKDLESDVVRSYTRNIIKNNKELFEQLSRL
jgi:glycine/serine hydroxymethyltransferase